VLILCTVYTEISADLLCGCGRFTVPRGRIDGVTAYGPCIGPSGVPGDVRPLLEGRPMRWRGIACRPVCGLIVAVLGLAVGVCGGGGREPTVAERYPGPWQAGFHPEITKTLAAKDVRGCGEYKFRPSRRDWGEYLVYCTADGKNWTAYVVWPSIKNIQGPLRPDPSLEWGENVSP
jgi:hypothetical protein